MPGKEKLKHLDEVIAQLEEKRKQIEAKLQNGEQLTVEEIWIMGEQLELDVLPNFIECQDMYYRKLFLLYRDDIDPAMGPLSPIHEHNLQVLVNDWLEVISGNCEPGTILAASKKETQKEIDELQKKWEANANISEEEKDEDLFWLLAWSKFRHVLVRKIFDLDVKEKFYSLHLNGKEIIFDYESATHILARHFAQGMKTYDSSKDHFYGVFRHDKLHLDFERIFHQIDQAEVYVNDNIADITIRYQGVIYKIWSNSVEAETFRISTFFPVSAPKILNNLQMNYSEVQVNDELTVFVKKQPI